MRKRISIVVVVTIGLLSLIFNAKAANTTAAPSTKPKSTSKGSVIRSPLRLNSAQNVTVWNLPDICAAYNFPRGLIGGEVIGIAEFQDQFGGGYTQSDLNLFSATYMNGTPINVTNVSVDGSVNSPGGDIDGEVALDIQIAAFAYFYCTGKAPTIKVFFIQQGTTDDDFVNANATVINAAVAAGCDVLSISYGLPENFASLSAANNLQAAAAAATAKGLTIFASSGDGNATDERQGEFDGLNHVSLPSSCPNVIAVGGTTKTPTSEVVWNNGTTLGLGYSTGTGGGYSTVFPVQSFQIGAPTAPTGNNGRGRMVPDVAANADFLAPYNIAFEGSIQAAGNGTSAACPLWAGMVSSFGRKQGFISSTLWLTANRATFVDITQGNNILFQAAVGPDPCTGLGVMNGTAIAGLFTRVPNPSNVVSTFAAGVLTITGDGGANALTISIQAGAFTITPGNGTTLMHNGASSTTNPVTLPSLPTSIAANMNAGDDGLAFIGVASNKPTLSINLGDGNDKASFTLCSIGVCTINGGNGTDAVLTTSSTFTKLTETNVP